MGRKRKEIYESKKGNLACDMLIRFNIGLGKEEELAFSTIIKNQRKRKTEEIRKIILNIFGLSQREFEDFVREKLYKEKGIYRDFSKKGELEIKKFILENLNELDKELFDKKQLESQLKEDLGDETN